MLKISLGKYSTSQACFVRRAPAHALDGKRIANSSGPPSGQTGVADSMAGGNRVKRARYKVLSSLQRRSIYIKNEIRNVKPSSLTGERIRK